MLDPHHRLRHAGLRISREPLFCTAETIENAAVTPEIKEQLTERRKSRETVGEKHGRKN
jgi:hypothetical protein